MNMNCVERLKEYISTEPENYFKDSNDMLSGKKNVYFLDSSNFFLKILSENLRDIHLQVGQNMETSNLRIFH
jgi:hypothetical protein